MRVELTVARTQPLPEGAMDALSHELTRRLNDHFPEYENQVSVRYASMNNLTVMGGGKDTREQVSHILQETRESADDWFTAD